MQRRRDHRTNRRIPCEFPSDGYMARGIVVDVSRRGLFVQTDAGIDPGEEIEVHLNGSSHFPAMTLRAVVVRRRKTPARLAVVVRRGIGLEILEAPPEWYRAVGEEPVEPREAGAAPAVEAGSWGRSEAAEPGASEPGAGTRGDGKPEVAPETVPPRAAAPAPERPPGRGESGSEFDALQELLFPSPEELPGGASEADGYDARDVSVLFPAADGWISTDAGGASQAIVIDNGELDDVQAMLEKLGAAPVRHRAEDPAGFQGWARPPRVLVVSARCALALRVPPRAKQDGVVAVAVAEEYSETLCTLMLRRGFRYVVRRPVHPEALRLLLMSALYRDRDHRGEPRLSAGCPVTYRQGLRRRDAILLEVSSRGCRLLTRHPVTSSTRLTVRIPERFGGGRGLSLAGRTVHCLRHGSDGDLFAIGLRFEALGARAEQQLERLLQIRSAGPAALPAEARDARPVAPDGEADGPASPEGPLDRRSGARGALRSEVLALDPGTLQVEHALVGVDLSRHGVRVEPHPELVLGDKLQLVLYDDHRHDPLLLEAEVARDDEACGLALLFRDPSPEQVARIEALVERLPVIERAPERPARNARGIAIGAIGRRAGDD